MNEFIELIFFSNIINFIIVIVFFIWLFRKFNIFNFIYKKRDEIVQTIKNYEQERKLKEHQLEVTKNKVKNVEQETEKIIDDGEEIAENLSERIIEEAEKEAANMQKKAHFTIESERKIAENEIMSEVTEAAFAIAEVKINEAIDSRMHQRYIDNFIDNLEKLK